MPFVIKSQQSFYPLLCHNFSAARLTDLSDCEWLSDWLNQSIYQSIDWMNQPTFTRWVENFFFTHNHSNSVPRTLHFTDDIFNCIFMNENLCILIRISLNFVPKGPINNTSALVQVMAWRRLIKPGRRFLCICRTFFISTDTISIYCLSIILVSFHEYVQR